jgi:hypothetical protein
VFDFGNSGFLTTEAVKAAEAEAGIGIGGSDGSGSESGGSLDPMNIGGYDDADGGDFVMGGGGSSRQSLHTASELIELDEMAASQGAQPHWNVGSDDLHTLD